MKIYTRTGDKGTTGLYGGTRIGKASSRIDAIGTIDELNSMLGVVVALLPVTQKIMRLELIHIQNDLFDIGASLATPKNIAITKGKEMRKRLPLRLHTRVDELEQYIDSLTEALSSMQTFILPGGGVSGSHLHVARTICRRAERCIVRLNKNESVDDSISIYINRLSDVLFTMARSINLKEKQKEQIWTKV